MTYLVTARKWRPQTFTEVIGQHHVTHTLQNAIRQGRIAHAYLFTGTRGVGKTTTARLLAKALNCQQGPTADPCNQCAACQEITAGNALDVFEIDGASNRGIDEIRDLREKIRYAPARGRYKIYIIDEVHMLTEHAFNALLKTLEEPPPQVVFVFATTEPHKVPTTILSRCQRFDFRKVPSAVIAECLEKIAEQEGIHISRTALFQIARRAEGSLRDAQTLFDQVIAFCGAAVQDDQVAPLLGLTGEEHIQHLLEAILAREARVVLQDVSHVFQRGHDTRELCRQLLEHVRDVIVVKTASDIPGAVDRSPSAMEGLRKLAKQTSVEELHLLFELLTETEARVRDSAQPMWVLEVALLKLASLPRLRTVSSLIARLETLERRLGHALDQGDRLPPPLPSPAGDSDASPGPSTTAAPNEASPPGTPAVLSPAPVNLPPSTDLVRKIIDSVSNRALGWILEQHCDVRMTETALEIVFRGNNRMARELLQEGEALRTLQEVARTASAREIAVRIVDIPEPNGERASEALQAPTTGDDLDSLSRTRIIRETLELFGGRILDIRRRAVSQDLLGRPMAAEEMTVMEEQDDE